MKDRTPERQEILTEEMLQALSLEFYYMMAQDSRDRVKQSNAVSPYRSSAI